MRQLLFGAVGIALLQSICQLFFEDGSKKNVLRLAGGIVLVTFLLSYVISFDYDAYASALRKSISFQDKTDEIQVEKERLDRMFIERECAAYILNRASALDVPLVSASVSLAWSTEGYWYPCSAELIVSAGSAESAVLTDVITADLGIPASALVWREEGALAP